MTVYSTETSPARRENNQPATGRVIGGRYGSGTQTVVIDNRRQSVNTGRRTISYRPQGRASVPHGVPRFLGHRRVLLAAWGTSMAVVCYDEWHNNGILPRPQRLWYTSLLYGLLMLVSAIDIMVPLANAIGIGFAITVIYQYYNKTGQFSG